LYILAAFSSGICTLTCFLIFNSEMLNHTNRKPKIQDKYRTFSELTNYTLYSPQPAGNTKFSVTMT